MAGAVIDGYLADLDGRLAGSRRTRRAILDEVEDGLREAVDQHRRAGLPAGEACVAAVAEFGDPTLVAAEFAPLLSARRVHRYGLGYLIVGPVIAVLWITAAVRGSFAAVPLPLTVVGIMLFAVAAVLAVGCTVAATAATGRAGRWIRISPERAARALLGSAAGSVLIDATLVVVLLVLVARSPHGLTGLPAALGAAVSLGRIGYAAISVIRLGADRTPC